MAEYSLEELSLEQMTVLLSLIHISINIYI